MSEETLTDELMGPDEPDETTAPSEAAVNNESHETPPAETPPETPPTETPAEGGETTPPEPTGEETSSTEGAETPPETPPATEPETAAETPPTEPEKKMVTIDALHEARQQIRELKEVVEQLRQPAATAPAPAPSTPPPQPANLPRAEDDPDPYDALEDSIPTVEDIKAHEAWGQRQAARQRWEYQLRQTQEMATESQKAEQALSDELSVENQGLGLDYQSVVKSGDAWLTPEDKAEIAAKGQYSLKEAGRMYYDRCLERNPHLKAYAEEHGKKPNAQPKPTPPQPKPQSKTPGSPPPPAPPEEPPEDLGEALAAGQGKEVMSHLFD